MIGYTQPEKSRLSTSKEKTSRRTNHSCSYQQLERRNLLTTFVVNTADDIIADDGLVSLREAITAANTNASFSDVEAGAAEGDRIVFSQEVRTSTLILNDELQILDDLVIRGFEDNGFDTSIQASDQSRIFNIDTNERVYFRDLDFTFGGADQGGLVKVNSGGDVTFDSSLLQNGSADQGGAVHAIDSRLLFSETFVLGNAASDTGGGIHAQGGEVILLQSFVASNDADEGGGAYVVDGTRLFAAESRFEANFSRDEGGGAIWAGTETSVQLRQNIFLANGSDPDDSNSESVDSLFGGAIAAFGDSLRDFDSVFFGNNAGRGGAVFSDAVTSVFFESRIEQNTATNRGGGGWFIGEEVRFFNSSIADNAAATTGGGLSLGIGSTAVLQNTTVLSNTAGIGAGISATMSDLRVMASRITDNLASVRGGGIDLTFSSFFADDTLFIENAVESGDGGAISSNNSTSFINFSRFIDNSAGIGGGISLRNVEDLTLRATLFESNEAGSGGAVFLGGNGTLRSIDSTFDSNTSDFRGGAVFVVGAGRFVSRGTTFVSNTAFGEGGAIANFGTANISTSTFESNRGIRGGAIKVGGVAGLASISDSTRFIANVAVANGAAISSTSSSITLIDDAEFSDNIVEDGFGDQLFVGDVTFHRITNSTVV